MDGQTWTALASVGVALIAAASAYASKRASTNAAAKNTRTEIEQAAFERAEKFMAGTIDRQDAEIEELRGEVDKLRADVRRLRTEREQDQQTIDARDQAIATRDHEIRRLAAALAAHGES